MVLVCSSSTRRVSDNGGVDSTTSDAATTDENGLKSTGSDWVEMHRNFGRDEDLGDRLTNTGTSDLDMRTQYAAWRQYMTGAAA